MPEELEIIIKPNGEIWVKVGNMEEERVRHYRELLESIIGPIKGVIRVDADSLPPGEVKLTTESEKEEKEEDRLRLDHLE